jgi:uncharacterized protein (TIGR02145 family)
MKTMKTKNLCLYVSLFLVFILWFGCKKEDNNNDTNNMIIETGTLTDIDGNVYKTVKIGNQWWMAENLRVKRYRNGDTIPELYSDIAYWYDNTFEGWANYNWDSAYDSTYGKIYSWTAVNNSKHLCPDGWHVPSDEEFTILSGYVDSQYEWNSTDPSWLNTNSEGRGFDAGKKLKSKKGWSGSCSNMGLDTYGFNALPGGYKRNLHFPFYGGPYPDDLWYAVFWTSTPSPGYLNRGWIRLYSCGTDKEIRTFQVNNTEKLAEGAYVRCIQDN